LQHGFYVNIILILVSGKKIILKEAEDKFANAALERIQNNFFDQVKKGRMSQLAAFNILKNLTIQTSYDNFDKLDLAIEAIFEDIELKQKTFLDLEKYTNDSCILASNTSTISIELIGEKCKCRNRIIGV
jgi:enoyl-CoA hydratase/3-hydroxyacyl-CoA dehydrogenase